MYEIPKLQVPIVLSLINDESIPGMMFITQDLVSPAGNPEIAEFLNREPDDFFSFESDAGAYRLINRRQVVYIETERDDVEIREQTPLAPRSLVLHFANDTSIYGVVFPTLAEETRVSDILNQDGQFFAIYRQGKQIIVNRHQIVYANAN
ncbi:MAG TPA: hypothetical protein VJ998_11805 [Pseudomonadales bacterium]|nr:hypothetical protein [Pseudomonadales bacterium]